MNGYDNSAWNGLQAVPKSVYLLIAAIQKRLEDFIQMAKMGETVNASIDLQKEFVMPKIHPDEEMKGESAMYLLSAMFTFKCGNEERRVSKVYLMGSVGETREDYNRLKNASISIEEIYF